MDDGADAQIVDVPGQSLAAAVGGAGAFAAHVDGQAAARATGLVGPRTVEHQVAAGSRLLPTVGLPAP